MSTEEPTELPSSAEVQASEDAYLTQLRRSMAGFLAHKISFSLFEAGRNQQLRSALEHLVSERLREQQISLEPRLLERLINDIYDGLPVQKPVVKTENEELTSEKLRSLVAPYLAQHISNDLLSPGHELALARRIQLLVDEKLALDQLQVNDELRYKLITLLCQGMNVEAPLAPENLSAPVATPPPQIPAAPLPPPVLAAAIPAVVPAAAAPALPPVPPERSPTKKVPKLSMRAHPVVEGKEIVEIAFTEEHKRHLLFTLGAKLDPAIMGTGDAKKIYQHIMAVLEQVSVEENVELDDEIKELLLNGLLTGEGMEFQL
jgi:hypothetical protein